MRSSIPVPSDDADDPAEEHTIVLDDATLKHGFAMLPHALLCCRTPKLSHSAKLTYALLLSYAWQKGSCFPGQTRLAHDLNTSRQAINRYLAELAAGGVIVVKRRGLGKTNVYRLPRLDTVLDVTPTLHQGVTQPLPPKGMRAIPTKGTPALQKEYTEEEDTQKKNPPYPRQSGGSRRTVESILERKATTRAAQEVEEAAKYHTGRYAVLPCCGSRPCVCGG